MPGTNEGYSTPLYIELEPELQQKLAQVAANHRMSEADYVRNILKYVLVEAGAIDERIDSAAWSRISAQSFTRDWVSEEDQVYDHLP